MAGMTDTAFRRLVKRHGGCGLVVTEMVSAEGLVRGIDRTLEYAEFTDEERPIAIQIFGGDPDKMAAAAQIVEGMGADIVDVNMGCPVPKIAKHNAGCSLMREPAHAAGVIAAMTRAVSIPVTVKMRAGWNDDERNAPTLAKLMQDAGAAAVAVHGRTAAQSYSGSADWDLVAQIAEDLTIPVFGSGDCIEPEQIVARIRSGVEGVLVGRGVLRNPWILAQATDLIAGRPPREVTLADRGRFLLDYIDLLLLERVRDDESRNTSPYESRIPNPESPVRIPRESRIPNPESLVRIPRESRIPNPESPLRMPRESRIPNPESRHHRWVVNKLRALASWYTKGLENGSHLRTAINSSESLDALGHTIETFFFDAPAAPSRTGALPLFLESV